MADGDFNQEQRELEFMKKQGQGLDKNPRKQPKKNHVASATGQKKIRMKKTWNFVRPKYS